MGVFVLKITNDLEQHGLSSCRGHSIALIYLLLLILVEFTRIMESERNFSIESTMFSRFSTILRFVSTAVV